MYIYVPLSVCEHCFAALPQCTNICTEHPLTAFPPQYYEMSYGLNVEMHKQVCVLTHTYVYIHVQVPTCLIPTHSLTHDTQLLMHKYAGWSKQSLEGFLFCWVMLLDRHNHLWTQDYLHTLWSRACIYKSAVLLPKDFRQNMKLCPDLSVPCRTSLWRGLQITHWYVWFCLISSSMTVSVVDTHSLTAWNAPEMYSGLSWHFQMKA